MNLTPSSPLAKARASHPTAKAPESALAFVVRCLLSDNAHMLLGRYWADRTFRDELHALLAKEQREAELSRYPDDGIAPTGPASAAVEMDSLGPRLQVERNRMTPTRIAEMQGKVASLRNAKVCAHTMQALDYIDETLSDIQRLRSELREAHWMRHSDSGDHHHEHFYCHGCDWEYQESTWELSGVGRNVTGPAAHAAHLAAVLDGVA